MTDYEFTVYSEFIERKYEGFIMRKWSDGFISIQLPDNRELHYKPNEYARVTEWNC